MAGQVEPIDAAAAFYDGTRLQRQQQQTITKPGAAGGLVPIQIIKTGFLQGLWLQIGAAIASAGGISAPNAQGMAAAIPQIRLQPNSANDLYNTSMFGYKKCVDPFIGSMYFPAMGDTLNQSNSAPAVGAFLLDAYLPVAMNRRDPLGLFNLQNPQTTLQLLMYFAPDSQVATGIDSNTMSCTPYADILTIFDPRVLPPQNYLHQLYEDTQTFTNGGDIDYRPVTGQTYLSVNHVVEATTGAGADNWTRFRNVVGGSETWFDETPKLQDMRYHMNYNAARPAGVLVDDMLASTELGTLSGLDRDTFPTINTTQWDHYITPSANGTLLTVRRQLIVVTPPGGN